MAVSVDSKIKVLSKNAAASEIINSYSPGFSTDPQMKMVAGLTLRKLASVSFVRDQNGLGGI